MNPINLFRTLLGSFARRDLHDMDVRDRHLSAQVASMKGMLEELKTAVAHLQDDLISQGGNDYRYLGKGVAIGRLQDSSVILMNSGDYGPALSVALGHRYEEGSINLILSFVRPDSIFLDIGANIGIFSLQIASRLTSGRVFAFEPQAELSTLLRVSAYINGINSNIEKAGKLSAFCLAASSANGSAEFFVPEGHAGGGRIEERRAEHSPEATQPATRVVPTAPLDEVLGENFTCDLVKMDVEGHELEVLQGMKGIVTRSPRVKIVFEFSGAQERAAGIEDFFADAGFNLWTFDSSLNLTPADLRSGREGNILATKKTDKIGDLHRNRFTIFPDHLAPGPKTRLLEGNLVGLFNKDDTISYGPYWTIQPGRYVLYVDFRSNLDISCLITSHFGVRILSRNILSSSDIGVEFSSHLPIPNFEIVFRALSDGTEVELRNCEIVRHA